MEAGFSQAVCHRRILDPTLTSYLVLLVCIQLINLAIAHTHSACLDFHEQQAAGRRHHDNIELAMAFESIVHTTQWHVMENLVTLWQGVLKTTQRIEFTKETAGLATCRECAWMQDGHAKGFDSGVEGTSVARGIVGAA